MLKATSQIRKFCSCTQRIVCRRDFVTLGIKNIYLFSQSLWLQLKSFPCYLCYIDMLYLNFFFPSHSHLVHNQLLPRQNTLLKDFLYFRIPPSKILYFRISGMQIVVLEWTLALLILIRIHYVLPFHFCVQWWSEYLLAVGIEWSDIINCANINVLLLYNRGWEW